MDEAAFEIWDAFKDINDDYYYVTGLMRPVYSVYLESYAHGGKVNSVSSKLFHIMTVNNKAFQNRRTDLVEGIQQRLKAWYPGR